jgi:hypothetical protein
MADLCIEIANPASGNAGAAQIGLANAGRIDVEPVAPATFTHDDLQPAISRLCERAGVVPRQIRRAGVSCGPGGFTATRTACAAGQMIALATGARCVRVPSALVALLAFLASRGGSCRQWLAGEGPGRVGVALASKGSSVWACVLDRNGARAIEPATHGLFDQAMAGTALDGLGLLALGPAIVLADAHLPAPIAGLLSDGGVTVEPIAFGASACLAAMDLCPDVPPERLLPIYPRQPEAVTLWQSRRAGPAKKTSP